VSDIEPVSLAALWHNFAVLTPESWLQIVYICNFASTYHHREISHRSTESSSSVNNDSTYKHFFDESKKLKFYFQNIFLRWLRDGEKISVQKSKYAVAMNLRNTTKLTLSLTKIWRYATECASARWPGNTNEILDFGSSLQIFSAESAVILHRIFRKSEVTIVVCSFKIVCKPVAIKEE
jgi:hypothetical protein